MAELADALDLGSSFFGSAGSTPVSPMRAFGDQFLIAGSDLDDFVKRRNDIAHNFWRLMNDSLEPSPISDRKAYLRKFISDAEHWNRIASGLLALMRKQAAKNEGRTDELVLTEVDQRNMEHFYRHVEVASATQSSE